MRTQNNETYKQIAAIVNSLSKNIYSYNELSLELRLKKCKYLNFTCGYLTKQFGIEAPSGSKKTIIIPSYPIHYLKFKTYIIEQRKRLENRTTESISINRPQSISINRNDQEKTLSQKYTKESNFLIFSDSEIVEELRKRGYEVSAKKVIEI